MASTQTPITAPLTTADGQPLHRALARASRKARWRAFLLVLPLLAFILITFIVPIGQMLYRSIHNDGFSANMPQIGPSRQAFKAFGRDPGRVRISSEALYRRVRQGKDLYRVNSAVDANNLVSLETGFSLGTYDLDCLQGDIVLRLGCEGEAYAGIGKDTLDLCRMPLLADDQGAFGCPCSDSRRAMIAEDRPETHLPRRLLTVIYGFSGSNTVSDALNITLKHLEVFADAQISTSSIVC